MLSPKKPLCLVSLFLACSLSGFSQNDRRMHEIAVSKLSDWKNPLTSLAHIGKPKIDSTKVFARDEKVTIYFSPVLSYYPFREDNSALFTESLKQALMAFLLMS